MNRSRDFHDSVSDPKSAVQQKHAPRPLPLFLELVRLVSQSDPELASRALQGLDAYERVSRAGPRKPKPVFSTYGAATVHDFGGGGPPLVLVPSLINPPGILDLDEETSLAEALARMGRRVLLIDWGRGEHRRSLSLSDHVKDILVRVLDELETPPAVVGYCLGGTMAIAAANLVTVERVVTLAAPWRFTAYPPESRQSLQQLWGACGAAAKTLGVLPMEVLQSAFWSLDPLRTVTKFADFSDISANSDKAQRFVTLEDWANEGEPLPYPAARELIEDLFGKDLPGKGDWRVGGRIVTDKLDCPMLNVTAANDRITPAQSAPAGEVERIESGHVGMIVGSARADLHALLNDFLAAEGSRR